MSNLKTNLFQGDVFIESSLDPSIYGSGNLSIAGNFSVGGAFTINQTNFNSIVLSGSTSGQISILPQTDAGTYNFNLPITAGTSGQALVSGGGSSTAMYWETLSSGTVTSVALSVPSFLSVTGSPVTSSGTLELSYSGTALPVLNGGTGTTTSTGTGNTVLSDTPTLVTPVLGAATGTSLSVTGNLDSTSNTLTGSISGVISILPQAAAGTYNFNLPITAGSSGQALVSGGGSSTAMYWETLSSGTVTSVALSVPSFLSVSGSPVTSSGTLVLSYSGTALPVLNGGTGTTTSTGSGSNVLSNTPTLVTPVLGAATGTSLTVTGNVNSASHTLTGSTTGVISILPQAIAGTYNFNLPITVGTTGQALVSGGGGSTAMSWTTLTTGTVTSVALSVPSFLSVTGSPITSSGTFAVSYSGTALPVLNGGTGTTTSTGSGSNVLSNTPTLVTPVLGAATGTSLSVTGAVNSSSKTLTGSTSGVISILPQPVAGTYNFNLPNTSGTSGQALVSGGGGSTAMTWVTLTTGTVTSVALSVPAFLSVSGSPITSSGTLALSYSGTALPVLNGGTGTTTSTGTGSVVLSNTPTLVTPVLGAATGTSLNVTGAVNSSSKTLTGSTSGVISILPQPVAGTYNFNLPITSGTSGQALVSGGGSTTAMSWVTLTTGTVTSVALSVPSFLSVSGSPITTAGTFAVSYSGTALPVLNGGTGTTTSTGTGNNVLSNTPTLVTPVLGAATGTSLTVTGNVNSSSKTLTGSTSGVISILPQPVAGTYNFNLPITVGTTGQALVSGGGGSTAMSWVTLTTGTVTSVALSVPAFLSVAGSPITSSGTFAISYSGTALPVLNGGTGTTTSTGTGSVVLSNTPTLVTPVLGAATGTSLSVSSNLISGGTITANGAGTSGAASTGTFYINPASTTLSGANSYFYTFFGTPTTTGSTTGSGSTVYIQGAPPNTTDPYALFVNSGATFLGGRLFLSTTSDIPAINPDAFNTLIVYENQTQSTVYSGVPTGSTTFLQNNYIQLTSTTTPSYGQIYWKRHAGNAFSASFDIYNGGTGGGNGASFFWHSTDTPSTTTSYNTGITTGYNLIFEDYAAGSNPGTSLWYNGARLGSTVSNISTLTNSQFNKVTVIFIRDCIRVFMNGVVIINFQDTTNRAPTALNAFIGFTGYNVNLGNIHRIRNIRISKTNEGLLEYASPTSNDLFINATNVGIGTTSPNFPLDVSGAGRFTGNVNSSSLTLSGSTSGTISILPQAAAGTYNFNLPTTAGVSGQALVSGGGGSTAMSWVTIGGGGTGTVTSVALSVPSFLSVSGSPITTSGTLALSYSGTALPVLNGGTGTTTSTGTGSVVLSDTPTLDTPVIGAATGTSLSVTGNIRGASFSLAGSTSGVISIIPQAAAGTYNFNLPTTAGVSGQVLVSGGGATNPMTWTIIPSPIYWYLYDEKPSGTNGGTFTAGSFGNIILNKRTTSDVTNSNASLNSSNGEFTLGAGKYYIEAFVPGYRVGTFLAVLRLGAATVLTGTSAVSGNTNNIANSYSIIRGVITHASTTTYGMFGNCSTTRTLDGKGLATGLGLETYASIKIKEIL